MLQKGLALVTDRGGHLHNALMLLDQMEEQPEILLSTPGPDTDSLRRSPDFSESIIQDFPTIFSFRGKSRHLNPVKLIWHIIFMGYLALKFRPKVVISLGASNVVPFCYWAKLLGAKIYHVECMNQVITKSITGKLLYPICSRLYVQWKDLLSIYGPKAQYAGWVL